MITELDYQAICFASWKDRNGLPRRLNNKEVEYIDGSLPGFTGAPVILQDNVSDQVPCGSLVFVRLKGQLIGDDDDICFVASSFSIQFPKGGNALYVDIPFLGEQWTTNDYCIDLAKFIEIKEIRLIAIPKYPVKIEY